MEKMVYVGCQLPKKHFTWTLIDIPGINPKVNCHHLNVNPNRRLVKQKKRNIVPKRQEVLVEEIDKLLAVGFIQEVYYPKLLANVVT